MLLKICKFLFFCSIIFYQNISYSKSFDEKNVYNYFSALVSLDINNNIESLNYFNSSKKLKESHPSYIKKYLFSLVLSEKINKAVNEIKFINNKKFADFFEAHLLLVLDNIKKEKYKEAINNVEELKRYEEDGTFEFIISNFLQEYIYLFNENEIKQISGNQLGKLGLINITLQNCYLGRKETANLFSNLVNFEDETNSRYLFFYANYLIEQKKYLKAEEIFEKVDTLDTSLLIAQSKKWLDQQKYNNFGKIFSCKNSSHIISELLFIISNLYSSEKEIEKSNFYFNLSNYLNPKFKFNLVLLADNYFFNDEFEKTKKILKNFSKKNEFFYWYKIKRNAQIIDSEKGEEESFKYIFSKFKDIENPSLKLIYEMGNVAKGFKKYDLSIEYYSKVLSMLDQRSIIYSEVLFRRGGSYERLGNEKKADEDLLQSLEINPNEPHVLNYLAYSWLERNFKIETAMDMLKTAYAQRKNDPYIIDSIGWAYYLIGDYINAEKLLRKAVQIMPDDPIVNDHYGDILWKLGKKTQANYFWKNVLTFDDTEEEMKENINMKLLKGLKNS
tara:strand:+ start:5017 stop:6693 length:1677 start_codon:yes stop_codon:yes gene_type:complete